MKLYLVYQSIDYEGGSVEGVFSTEEKAIDYWKVHHPDSTYSYQYKEIELDIPCEINI